MERVLGVVIPSLVREGVFGDAEYADLTTEDDQDIGAQFASCLAFVRLTVRGPSGLQVFPLVVKAKMKGREKDSSVQFHMEFLMYKEVLPLLNFNPSSYPKLHYATVTDDNPKEDVFIFENLKYRDFRIGSSISNSFLDYDHISVALKKIAEFHSLSYVLKHEDTDKFSDVIKKLDKYSYYAEMCSRWNPANFAAIERGVRAFEKINGHEELLDNFLDALKHPIQLRDELAKPEGLFGVVCHGDFCNNNVMYRYDKEGRPIECAFFDFQTSKYGSIATELSFFLYMHTDSDSRRKHWDDFLRIYWKTLRENVPDKIELPSFDDFLGHFARRAVYGYTNCSFYLPMMIGNVGYWGDKPVEDQVELNKTMAGEEGEEKIMDIVSHMYHKKYIHAFLDYKKTN